MATIRKKKNKKVDDEKVRDKKVKQILLRCCHYRPNEMLKLVSPITAPTVKIGTYEGKIWKIFKMFT